MSLSSETLVSTKLRPSQARPNLVARPRLLARLERVAGRRLTLISAPAGFGKTTLLVEWLGERVGGEGLVRRRSARAFSPHCGRRSSHGSKL